MNSRSITDLDYKEAKKYFLKSKSYINFELPDYLDFEQLLIFVKAEIRNRKLKSLCTEINGKKASPFNFEKANYTILGNKDGAYSWRPLQIIHPVLYVELINLITESHHWSQILDRFKDFSKSVVDCMSLPRESLEEDSDKAAQIHNWWEKIEQETVKRALTFKYLFKTDISDCYGSIYTHSIEWALNINGKEAVKRDRKNEVDTRNSLGHQIDIRLQGMNYGQTNGIPQGSVISDFLAEIILGYADLELTYRISKLGIKKQSFSILRYRDDYRILTQEQSIGQEILKELNLVLYDLGLKMHPGKTEMSEDIVGSSFKSEKLHMVESSPSPQLLQKEALRLYLLSKKFPNTGLLKKELESYFKKLKKLKKSFQFREVCVSIFAQIPIHSPLSVDVCAAIIAELLAKIKESERKKLTLQVIQKYKELPIAGFTEIWLQRISEPMGVEHDFDSILCKVAVGEIENINLWQSDWLDPDLIKIINFADITDLPHRLINKSIKPTMSIREVEMFVSRDYLW